MAKGLVQFVLCTLTGYKQRETKTSCCSCVHQVNNPQRPIRVTRPPTSPIYALCKTKHQAAPSGRSALRMER